MPRPTLPAMHTYRRRVIRAGLGRGLTLAAIGQRLDLCRERIRQLVSEYGIAWDKTGNRERRQAAARLRRYATRSPRHAAVGRFATEASRRGFEPFIVPGRRTLTLNGLAVSWHSARPWWPPHCRHAGYLRYNLTNPARFNVSLLPNGVRLFALPHLGGPHLITVRADRLPTREQWPTPTELMRAAKRVARATLTHRYRSAA